jgi:hypothetical protein
VLWNQWHLTAWRNRTFYLTFNSKEETMASNFTKFLLTLGEDPKQLEAFKHDPHPVLDAAGLTPAEKALLLSENIQLIRSALLSDPGLKEAMGIPPEQKILRLPTCIWRVPQPVPPAPLKAVSTGDSGGQGGNSGSKGA